MLLDETDKLASCRKILGRRGREREKYTRKAETAGQQIIISAT